MKITVEKEYEISLDDIQDIIHTAVEGGIGYWSQVSSVSEYMDEAENRQALTLYPYEHDEFEAQTLLPAAIAHGIKMYCKFANKTPDDLFGDYGDFDAGDADVIVQFALFNQIVFA